MPAGQDRDTEAGDRKQARPALDLLNTDPETGAHRLWICRLGRSLIRNFDLGPLIAFSAACAWRDRGPQWGRGESWPCAETPPGGWPALAGVTGKTWAAYRDEAVRARILAHARGEARRKRNRRPVPLLRPLIAEAIEAEQFARIPAAVLFHDGLGLRAKRVYLALALRADRERMVYVANESLVSDTGIAARHLRRVLGELEAAGAIERGRQGHRYGVRPTLLRG